MQCLSLRGSTGSPGRRQLPRLHGRSVRPVVSGDCSVSLASDSFAARGVSVPLPQLTRLHLGGPFPLLRPEFDLVRLTDLIQTFRTHHPLTLELTVGETLFGGALTPLPYDPGMEFPPEKPRLYTGTPDAPVPFLHF